jgi:hypothetical protein
LNKIILNIKNLFIYNRYKLKLVKRQFAKDEITLDTSSTAFSPILLSLKIGKEKVNNPNKYLKSNFKSKEKN